MDFTALEHGKVLTLNRTQFNLVEMLEKTKKIIMGYTHYSEQVDYEAQLLESFSLE